MKYEVQFQKHKYSDRSDSGSTHFWKITADSPEQAWIIAHERRHKFNAAGGRIGNISRIVRLENGDLYTVDGNYPHEDCAVCHGN